VLVALCLVATAGCGAAEETTAESAPEPAPVIDLHHVDVAGDYATASDALRQRGREVVDRLLAGDIASVYEQTAPQVKAKITLAEVERSFAEEQAAAPIGPRVEERVIPVGPEQGVYLADHSLAEGRLRFQIGFDPSGLMPLVQPVTPLPPDPRAMQPATTNLRLPFDGLWWAGEAPTPEIGNHHAVASDQRHAFDFLIWRDGSTHRGEGKDNADYWAWGQAVRAPATGTVVAVQDGLIDNRPGATDTAHPAGNHVVIDLGYGEYAVLAHFQNGSLRVVEGDEVTSGQVLGLVGSSGNSSEPHIHFHVQDSPKFQPGGSVGIPVRFDDYEADGTVHAQDTPSGGQFVAPTGPATKDG